QVMAWIMNQYEKYHGFNPAVVTGKPVELHGSEGREEATGRGVVITACQLLGRLGRDPQGATVALQGFGNVGSNAAKFLQERGAVISGISDASGGVWRRDGLDIAKLSEYVRTNGGVHGFPDAEAISNEEVLESEVDLLIPAALGGVLTKENAPRIRA